MADPKTAKIQDGQYLIGIDSDGEEVYLTVVVYDDGGATLQILGRDIHFTSDGKMEGCGGLVEDYIPLPAHKELPNAEEVLMSEMEKLSEIKLDGEGRYTLEEILEEGEQDEKNE